MGGLYRSTLKFIGLQMKKIDLEALRQAAA